MKYCVTMTEYVMNETLRRSVFDTVTSRPNEKAPSLMDARGDVLFVGRSCMSYFAGNDCSEGVKNENGNKRNVIVCKKYCSSDGCNGANTVRFYSVFGIGFLIVAYLAIN